MRCRYLTVVTVACVFTIVTTVKTCLCHAAHRLYTTVIVTVSIFSGCESIITTNANTSSSSSTPAIAIGGFRDTYLGRQVVSRPRGLRAGMGSAGGLGERCELPWRGLGQSPNRNRIWGFFSLKIWQQMATISTILLRINWPNFARHCLPGARINK